MRGVVLAIKDGRPVPNARVRLSPGQTGWQRTSSEGRFHIANSGGTAATLEVRARGYDAVSVAIPVRTDSAVAVVATLAVVRVPHRARECGGPSLVPSDSVD